MCVYLSMSCTLLKADPRRRNKALMTVCLGWGGGNEFNNRRLTLAPKREFQINCNITIQKTNCNTRKITKCKCEFTVY